MQHSKRFAIAPFSVAVVILALARAATVAADGAYTFATLDAPGQAHTFLYDVNDTGAVVGQGYDEAFAVSTGVLAEGGTFSFYAVPGAVDSSLNSVNNRGQLAGSYSREDGVGVAFLLDGPERQDFTATPDAIYTTAGVNEHGTIAGSYTVDFSTISAFVRSSGATSSFDAPGAFITQAFKANNRGDVVGWFFDGASHGYVRGADGSFETIDYPGAFLTRAFGINDKGEVTGYVQMVRRGPIQGFVWSKGRFTATVTYPGMSFTVPQGINNAGDLVGYYRDGDGRFHGFSARR